MVVFTVDFKLENFVTEQQVSQITSLTMDFLAVNIQKVTVPAMQSVSPHRTGRLKQSIRVERTRTGIIVYAVFYYIFPAGLAERWAKIFNEQLSRLLQISFNKAVAQVLPAYQPS